MQSWPLSEFLRHLRSLDIRLSLDGERLACSAPKGALSADVKAELQRRKTDILIFLAAATTADSSAPPPLAPAAPGSAATLSYAQRRLWFLDRMEPGNPMYNMPGVLRMVGPLDRDALDKTLRAILDRHTALRTSFRDTADEPIPVLETAPDWRMDVESLFDVPENEREAEMRRRALAEIQRPFDLAVGPLLRAKLFVVRSEEHVLVFVMHHIASDGWSLGVFVNEMTKFYEAFRDGRDALSAVPPMPVQYSDYAAWHRRWMESGVLETQLPFWRRTLSAPLPRVELPLDRPRPALQTHRGRQAVF